MDQRVAEQAAAGEVALREMLGAPGIHVTWLMFGAHPDDEWSGFLAWLTLGRGIRTVFACATRGEGGQNAVGPEWGAALGAIRTAEMERAARAIGAEVFWLSPGGGDPIVDFGFSRSGTDTLRRWGERRLVERMARAIRDVRPDAVSPTFLDVSGQHGHHRAVTQSLEPAMALAADPAWECGLPRWQVEHAYLPAFSGGGGTYDDEVPPPPATVTVDLGERCPPLGASWAQIGEWSRRFHASQGMGRWIEDGPRPLPLHKFRGPPDVAIPLDAFGRTPAPRPRPEPPPFEPGPAPALPDRIVRRLGDARDAVPPGRWETPARITLGLDCAIDAGARVGLVAGPTDRTGVWLAQLGIPATPLDDATLAACDFAAFTTIIVGMRAFRQRPALVAAGPAIGEWVRGGGKLVTFYHQAADEFAPPARLAIGAPSYRWRVTEPDAPVRILAPDSLFLTTPNAIGPGDWDGWVRERGLYFAAAWDVAYRPVVEMHDAGMPALQGAVLDARIGRGAHVHVTLALHHQWDAQVPGAFRLLANLAARLPH